MGRGTRFARVGAERLNESLISPIRRPLLSDTQFHHFTVDVEEYFQASAMEPAVPRERWPQMESRISGSIDLLLDLMDAGETKGTFFVLGIVAEAHPDVVRRIVARGHEVASHGWDHRRVTTLGPREFREAVRKSRLLLQDLSGQPVVGYRAPSFSITPGREWALDILIEEGFRYDSSLFPVRRRGYGHPGAPTDLSWLERKGGRLLEVPPTVLKLPGIHVPAGGGAYFRLFPYGVVRSALRRQGRRGTPGTFYIHPWELDPDQPRLPVGLVTRVRHYGGLTGTRRRLARLLGEFRFQPVSQTLEALCPVPS